MTVPAGPDQVAFRRSMTDNPNDAPGFIAAAIKNLTQGGGNYGGDSFDPGLSQDEEASALEFQQQDNSGNYVFNFAVARVRLLGKTPGAQAQKVRVFFRLFQAQTTNSDFNTGTTYRFQSDNLQYGVTVPLLGVQSDQNGNPEYVTIPFFATPRNNIAGAANMQDQPEDTPNAYTITVNPGVEVDSFFGCWLDINQPEQKFLPSAPPGGIGTDPGPRNGARIRRLCSPFRRRSLPRRTSALSPKSASTTRPSLRAPTPRPRTSSLSGTSLGLMDRTPAWRPRAACRTLSRSGPRLLEPPTPTN